MRIRNAKGCPNGRTSSGCIVRDNTRRQDCHNACARKAPWLFGCRNCSHLWHSRTRSAALASDSWTAAFGASNRYPGRRIPRPNELSLCYLRSFICIKILIARFDYRSIRRCKTIAWQHPCYRKRALPHRLQRRIRLVCGQRRRNMPCPWPVYNYGQLQPRNSEHGLRYLR
ncbi:MAG: hypothetical protein BWX81_00628 [Spirochaetes bacterium ADurb.Bin110]|nr:MAG: hypothetical protein BWX81_00628 [Spirochaetes bacterium ADurb.Bin110]